MNLSFLNLSVWFNSSFYGGNSSDFALRCEKCFKARNFHSLAPANTGRLVTCFREALVWAMSLKVLVVVEYFSGQARASQPNHFYKCLKVRGKDFAKGMDE